MLIILLITACGKNDTAKSYEAEGICGCWAYTHDKETGLKKETNNKDGNVIWTYGKKPDASEIHGVISH